MHTVYIPRACASKMQTLDRDRVIFLLCDAKPPFPHSHTEITFHHLDNIIMQQQKYKLTGGGGGYYI